ncbi:MAG: single-stranded DNA-binding protein [Bacteriovoracia bacterium]
MTDFNKVMLLGRVGHDLELRTTVNGKPYLKMSIATHSYNSRTEVKKTSWHQVFVFGPQAEICATYLQKGSEVLIEGSLDQTTYEDEEKQKRYTVGVLASRVYFLGSRVAVESKSEQTADAISH